MITCKKVCDSSSEFIDGMSGQLSLWSHAKIKYHLFSCILCRRYLKQLKLTNTMVRQTAKIPTEGEAAIEAMVKRLQEL